MNERDKEIYQQATGKEWAYDFDVDTAEKFADLIRADTMEAATRAANQSWMLLAKSMIAAEREACAKVCEGVNGSAVWFAKQIRARGNT